MAPAAPRWTTHQLACGDLAPLVTADMHERWGVDLDHDPAARCWHWWVDRVQQLLTLPPTITPLQAGGGLVTQPTRTGNRLFPPRITGGTT